MKPLTAQSFSVSSSPVAGLMHIGNRLVPGCSPKCFTGVCPQVGKVLLAALVVKDRSRSSSSLQALVTKVKPSLYIQYVWRDSQVDRNVKAPAASSFPLLTNVFSVCFPHTERFVCFCLSE